ncbi:MAG: NosD domain-containing protein, partial [Methanoregula sp.]|nr:NosD domain-containing protein [Methanoregula sp.]
MKKTMFLFCMIALFSAIIIIPASATTWPIYNGQNIDDYTKIGGAHFSEVSEWDTIFVYNGTYAAFTVDKPSLTIKGESKDVVRIETGDSIQIPSSSGNGIRTIIDGFSVLNSVHGLSLGNVGSATGSIIKNCIFDGISYDDGIKIEADDAVFENNTIRNATGIYTGIYVWCINGTLKSNDISGSTGAGLDFYDRAQETTVAYNNIHDNGYAGFEFYNTVEIQYIFLNNIVNNGVPATASGTPVPATLLWNTTAPQSYVYNGNTYSGFLGNYWGTDYAGSDTNGDGIGDTPFELPEGLGYDYAPLMEPFENYAMGGQQSAPTAAFTSESRTGTAPLTVTFTDQSTGSPTTWAWDVNNDGSVDYTTQNATHTYTAAGNYTVNLGVTNAGGSDSEVK